ncbi:ECF transporter S component [Paraclostridium sordellii]|uniref:Metal ion ABC transporter membrane-spanning subunit n=1 Tax=Paraclostridium sordellii TaxID=1505 RepID=A0A0C7QEJ8_PARSO|nr:ECF transporter S component [Paeniclostridium sordellii]CEN78192.1 metal ion ABC transporter membrane-spanning subunit [[Clostridium] sordellii] [Paeniclostridium sordellii]CEO07902.1 metal ion ABC transporter membrane-spanning subunit [[Clostridium] sordellii] [Paeniclostridium sordellii]CEP87031.1 metal ion ABC transporter membrane-spanning subunit [[Clostridium] sordellii] [Paeniclostridium sordellii]CEP95368.1 metal ion ABC transporter membrane-spanning subunit [[Clostridium] sordellii] 
MGYEQLKECKHEEPNDKRIGVRTILASILILIVIPTTILFGVFVLNDRKYYLISIMIILYTIFPFIMVFENRKPQARELVVIAVLSAIAVAGRSAFFMLPQFKPVVAVVIISGVCFGAESGFLVGAVSGFVSNFFFRQGPWTPWQMFCFGIIGFLAGILFKRGKLKKTKTSLCIFGGLATFFIYGGIIDIWSLFMFTSNITIEAIIAIYTSAIPFNLIHSAATVFFLFIISDSMIEKLDRIKVKYGLIEP